ncbi:hypothetical protein BWR15_15810 [Pseudomonas sp. T]|nr:hypothetical protein BWR15_15810 [Pseudomonas sp. T]
MAAVLDTTRSPVVPHRTPLPRPTGDGLPIIWRADQPDRDASAFLRMLNLATRIKPFDAYSLEDIRELWRLTALALSHRPELPSVHQHHFEGPGGQLLVRVYKPREDDIPRPAFLWVHGGGFMVGGLDTADSICRNIALEADCITVALSYRLAPEHGLDASREDCLAGLDWVIEHAEELGIDASRLAIGGESAGGNLAAVMAQEARRRELELALQVLVYPATELEESFPSLRENVDGYMITADMLGHIQRTVAGAVSHLDLGSPWLSPRRERNLSGLTPAVVVSAGFDPIRDDGLDYTSRLRKAKVPVQLLHYPGQFHGFLNFDAINGGAADALRRIASALVQAFAGEHPDITLEMADPTSDRSLFGEGRSTTLSLWNATDGWRDALLTRANPRLARVTRWALRPYTIASRPLRHVLQDEAAHLAVQTYPAES